MRTVSAPAVLAGSIYNEMANIHADPLCHLWGERGSVNSDLRDELLPHRAEAGLYRSSVVPRAGSIELADDINSPGGSTRDGDT